MTKLQEKLEAAKEQLNAQGHSVDADNVVTKDDDLLGADAALDTEFAKDLTANTLNPKSEEPFTQSMKSLADGNKGSNNPLEGLPMYEAKQGSYKNIRLHSVILKNGDGIKPNEYGYYESPTGELKELLQFYAKKGFVELVE